jgi:triacylglycerol lipase
MKPTLPILASTLVFMASCATAPEQSAVLPTPAAVYGSEPDMGLACRLMQASRCAYGVAGDSFRSDSADFADCKKGYKEFRFYEDPDEHINAVLAGLTDNEIILAYRGTLALRKGMSNEEALKDWLQDGDALFVHEDGIDGEMHRGFLKAFTDTWDPPADIRARTTSKPLKDILEEWRARGELDGKRIYVTGHSKGGPVAIIAAVHLHRDHMAPAAVYTFAGARAGNASFTQAYLSRNIPTWRFENRYDVVPHLALNRDEFAIHALLVRKFPNLTVRDYESVGNLMFINWDGKLQPATEGLARMRREKFVALWEAHALQQSRLFDIIAEAHSSSAGGAYHKAVCGTAR